MTVQAKNKIYEKYERRKKPKCLAEKNEHSKVMPNHLLWYTQLILLVP